MTLVTSKMIESVGHEGDTLYVKFGGGTTYKYSPVSGEEYAELLNSDSVGGYFSRNIKKVKNFEKVEESGESED